MSPHDAKRKARPGDRRPGRHERRGPRAGPAQTPPRREPFPDWPLAALGLVLFAALWLQRSAFRAPFFADDYLFLDQVRQRSLAAVLRSPDPIGNFLRPVGRQLHFWWLAKLSHESPLAFHAANLALFAGALVLLFVLVRRLAGGRAAAVAAAFVGLHYAADVPLRWASGSQDLLAVVLALGAILLHVLGRRALAALAFLAAMLSKETVLFTPLIALLLDRRADERWSTTLRRAWPLGAAGLAWAALWIATVRSRPGAGAAMAFEPAGLPASLVHLAQVALGLEWREAGFERFILTLPPLLPLAAAGIAIWCLTGGRTGPSPGAGTVRPAQAAGAVRPAAPARSAQAMGAPRPARLSFAHRALGSPMGIGLLWAMLGALPVAAAVSIWSAYYYLFALLGLALAFGAWTARWPRALTVAAVAVVAWTSQGARRLDEFATAHGVWTTESHVNRFYIERSMRYVTRYLRHLYLARPTVPHRSTIFFSGVPSFSAWQAADGPLVRWAYRDSSLRAHYLTEFTAARERRGPAFYFVVLNDSLTESWRNEPPYRGIAFTMLLEDRHGIAREALEMDLAHGSTDPHTPYWLAWVKWAGGDSSGVTRLLRDAGVEPVGGPTPEIDAAFKRLAAGDSAGAIDLVTDGMGRHGFDPRVHGLLADLLLPKAESRPGAYVEALAARVLAPENPLGWRRWAMIQATLNRFPHALRSMERYFALGGAQAARDEQALRVLQTLRRVMPGGDIMQQALRSRMPAP